MPNMSPTKNPMPSVLLVLKIGTIYLSGSSISTDFLDAKIAKNYEIVTFSSSSPALPASSHYNPAEDPRASHSL